MEILTAVTEKLIRNLSTNRHSGLDPDPDAIGGRIPLT